MQGKRAAGILLALVIAFHLPLSAWATSVEEATQAVEKTEGQIEETKREAEQLEAQKSMSEAELRELNRQLNELLAKMEQTASDIADKQEEISDKETELIQAQIDENNQYQSMKKRIKYMYENGDMQFIEILLSSKSISELLNNAEYITKISEYDRDMLTEFQNTVKKVKEQKKLLEEQKEKLEELQNQLSAQQEEVNRLLAEKAAEISNLKSALGANAERLASLQEEVERQIRLREEAIAAEEARKAAEEAARAAAARQNTEGSSGAGEPVPVNGSGTLNCPCPQGYVSSEFGGRASPGGIGSTNHKGRDYAAAYGSGIYAAANGTVTTVGYNGARGNYVVVNHGGGLSTLYQHCSAIYVSIGQSVAVGQNIAAIGTSGISTGPHLHFEVWVNGIPTDPRYYL